MQALEKPLEERTARLGQVEQAQHIMGRRKTFLAEVRGSDDAAIKQVAAEQESTDQGVSALVSATRRPAANRVAGTLQVIEEAPVDGVADVEPMAVLPVDLARLDAPDEFAQALRAELNAAKAAQAGLQSALDNIRQVSSVSLFLNELFRRMRKSVWKTVALLVNESWQWYGHAVLSSTLR